jgi:DNA helicase HerA-like ATPase
VLIDIDEAHFVAPQKGKVPEPVIGLATTGRGEGASSIWITQRLAKLEEDVASQCQARLLGGFESSADLNKVEAITEYPVDLHNPQVRTVVNVPAELTPSDRDRPESLQKHVENGDTVGSEWIYSDNTGRRERRNTEGLAAEMDSTHFGKQGKGLEV